MKFPILFFFISSQHQPTTLFNESIQLLLQLLPPTIITSRRWPPNHNTHRRQWIGTEKSENVDALVAMGYNRQDIEDSLSQVRYDDVFATYLLLGRKSTDVSFNPAITDQFLIVFLYHHPPLFHVFLWWLLDHSKWWHIYIRFILSTWLTGYYITHVLIIQCPPIRCM